MLRTTKQRKTLCPPCPVARVADMVGDSASLLIIRDLLEGPKRFGELTASLGMSTRTLTLKLRQLKRCGFISTGKIYALTSKGKALRSVLTAMRRYGEKYL